MADATIHPAEPTTNGHADGRHLSYTEEQILNLDLDALTRQFEEEILPAYSHGSADVVLLADLATARSWVPAGTGVHRDFSYIATEIPEYEQAKCTGCMTCVTECPDTAILGVAITEATLESELAKVTDAGQREHLRQQFARTKKYWDVYEKKGEEPALFGIFIDPTKCKGCAECVQVCDELDYHALRMIPKQDETVPEYQAAFSFFSGLETPETYINERALADIMLRRDTLRYVGGAGSCAGCGEASALRMFLSATCFQVGRENVGIVNATGCSTVYASTYPYNPWDVPWTNSLFENAPADAMGVRQRWNQLGWEDKKLWVIGGDGAMLDIGFQSLSRALASGLEIKYLVLDTQVYSNTGGQASTGSYMGQNTKMSQHGTEHRGKTERRKEITLLAMMHPNVYVAQTTAAHINHFYRCIMEANEFDGPALISIYTTCQPEHMVGDHMAGAQAKLAVDSRAFPLMVYDPRRGDTIAERMDLKGNPAMNDDWYTIRKTGETVDFLTFARSEGRFGKHFDRDGNPTEELLAAQADRLANWHKLQELAGLR